MEMKCRKCETNFSFGLDDIKTDIIIEEDFVSCARAFFLFWDLSNYKTYEKKVDYVRCVACNSNNLILKTNLKLLKKTVKREWDYSILSEINYPK